MLQLIYVLIFLSFKYCNQDKVFEIDIREDKYIVKSWMLWYIVYMSINKDCVYDYILIIGTIMNMCVDKLWHGIHYRDMK